MRTPNTTKDVLSALNTSNVISFCPLLLSLLLLPLESLPRLQSFLRITIYSRQVISLALEARYLGQLDSPREPGWPSYTPRHWVLILVAFYDTHELRLGYSLLPATTRGHFLLITKHIQTVRATSSNRYVTTIL
jgi:hypothetical protein